MSATATPSSARCEGCGFEWEAVLLPEIPPRLIAVIAEFIGVIADAGEAAGERPSPERWSVLEYGGHLRDVLLSLRERVILASVTEVPTGTPIHRDERVDLGFYREDRPADLAEELVVATRLFAKTLDLLPDGFEERRLVYSPISSFETTIAWVAAQGLHEAGHHLGDVMVNLALLGVGEDATEPE